MYTNELPKFLFCNSKSVELFGENLGDLSTASSESSRDKSTQLLELPQFVQLEHDEIYDNNSEESLKTLSELRNKLIHLKKGSGLDNGDS